LPIYILLAETVRSLGLALHQMHAVVRYRFQSASTRTSSEAARALMWVYQKIQFRQNSKTSMSRNTVTLAVQTERADVP
jgi:hypothetical protein